MIRHTLLAASLLVATQGVTALSAAAETPMTGAEFDAYATGKTLSYSLNGVIYGTEVYKPDRKVLWAFTKEECRTGYWYEQADEICFVYEDPNDPQCWQFFGRMNGLWARYMGDAADAPMSGVSPSADPLSCAGPDVGA